MNSVEDKVMSLKEAIREAISRDHTLMKIEHFWLVSQTSLMGHTI
jgi:hypothetical protein